MANSAQTQNQNWTSTQAYVLAVICFVVGIAIGYLVRGSGSTTQPATAATASTPTDMGNAGAMGPGQLQAIPQQQSPDVVAAAVKPLIEALKSNPNDFDKLVQVGNMYYDANVYPEAITYYTRAVKISPDPNVLTDLGTAYFYTGDSSTALSKFNEALKQDPKLANALFNTGIVKWQGLKDPKGAIEVWEKLLKENPNYEGKDKVKELIERAKAHGSMG
jgi:cytochrome c-type biogenesis protein CcmH/NrfG